MFARVAGGLALHGPAFAHWIHEVGSDAQDAIETFTDAYRGTCDSFADYAEQLLEDLGIDRTESAPEWLRGYIRIDYEGLGRDLAMDLGVHPDSEGIHVFEIT